MRLIDADAICFDELKNDFDRARAKIIIMGQPTVLSLETLCEKCLRANLCKKRLAMHNAICDKFKSVTPPPPPPKYDVAKKQGHWMPQWEGSRLVKCSVCGYEYCDLIECGNYCGNCGAKMDNEW